MRNWLLGNKFTKHVSCADIKHGDLLGQGSMYTDRLVRRHVTVVSEVPRVFQPTSRHGTHACTTRDSRVCPIKRKHNGVFPKWSRTFIEFSDFGEFRESGQITEA